MVGFVHSFFRSTMTTWKQTSCGRSGTRKERANGRSQRRHQSRTAGPKVSAGAAADPSPELRPPALTPEQLIERLMEAEPPEIYLMKEMRRPLTEADVMMSLTNLADRELVHMISWAKKIPGERRNPSVSSCHVVIYCSSGQRQACVCAMCVREGFVELSVVDQVHLLECCWLEVLMLGLMWRSVDHPGRLIFSPDLSLNRYHSTDADALSADPDTEKRVVSLPSSEGVVIV